MIISSFSNFFYLNYSSRYCSLSGSNSSLAIVSIVFPSNLFTINFRNSSSVSYPTKPLRSSSCSFFFSFLSYSISIKSALVTLIVWLFSSLSSLRVRFYPLSRFPFVHNYMCLVGGFRLSPIYPLRSAKVIL